MTVIVVIVAKYHNVWIFTQYHLDYLMTYIHFTDHYSCITMSCIISHQSNIWRRYNTITITITRLSTVLIKIVLSKSYRKFDGNMNNMMYMGYLRGCFIAVECFWGSF